MNRAVVALHRAFDFSTDALVFDVGHQCYPHKLLTGRLGAFSKLRTREGMAGFPEPRESDFDLFSVGHGVTITDTSVYGLVSRAYNLRMNALIQQQAISLGGKITYLEGQPAATQPAQPVVPTGNGGGRGADRSWEYWLRTLPLDQ